MAAVKRRMPPGSLIARIADWLRLRHLCRGTPGLRQGTGGPRKTREAIGGTERRSHGEGNTPGSGHRVVRRPHRRRDAAAPVPADRRRTLESHLQAHGRSREALRASPPATGRRAGHRPRHGPRASNHLGHRQDGGSRPTRSGALRGRGGQRRTLLRDGLRGGPRTSGRSLHGEALSRGGAIPDRPLRHPGARRSTPGRSGPDRSRGSRTQGGLPGPPAEALANPVGEVQDPRARGHGGSPRGPPGPDARADRRHGRAR